MPLISGFCQHIVYMILLIALFMLQHGSTVSTRYSLVETIKAHIGDLQSPNGTTFESIANVDEVWDWTENAFYPEIVGSERVYIRTYNQVVGSVRLETARVGWSVHAADRNGASPGGAARECPGRARGAGLAWVEWHYRRGQGTCRWWQRMARRLRLRSSRVGGSHAAEVAVEHFV